MKTIKITRTGFPGNGNFSWMNYFRGILAKKYKVEINSNDPDLVFYSNLHWNANDKDHFTGQAMKGLGEYENSKKIFISGEANPGYHSHIQRGNYALGYEHIDHDRYLRFPTYILDAFVLHNEGGMFPDAFSWITKARNAEEILKEKQHFCSVVQKSDQPQRGEMFDIIERDFWIKSSGPWRGKPGLDLNIFQYHDNNHIGKIDGLCYKDKINFFRDCYFNIAFQWCNLDYLIQEKIIHAFAADTIPIFYGNKYIEEEGFNPDAFINTHLFENFEHAYDSIKEIYNDKKKLKRVFSEPIFTNNKLPIYFDEEYMLSFLTKIIES